ncbi:MAG: hypothetical protein ABI806_28320 [Candidatus Solibacter sp.]
MKTVAGVFGSSQVAKRAAEVLRQVGLANISLLFPGSSESSLDAVPTDPTEQPGMGAALGGLVGGAVGMASGLGIGAAASLLVPGVGPVLAIGLAGAALFGASGAAGGAAAGAALEQDSTIGLPADELYVYKDALRRGKSVLFVQAGDDDEAQRATMALNAAGAESIDAARDQHWIGLRDAEREHYQSLGGSFDQDEREYRRGFQAAMSDQGGSRSAEREASSYAYRRGYDRGVEWCREMNQNQRTSI